MNKQDKQLVDKDTVKIDLEKEFFDWYHEERSRDYNASILYERYDIISKKLAKHFFDLGMAVSNKPQKTE